jgi:branched-chain amino acid transport system substrate-binding protein
MGPTRRALLAAIPAGLLARPALLRAQSSAPIRIGEINSYASQPGFASSYRKGWEMALGIINDRGGLDGRKLEIVASDDGGDPAQAVRLATELVDDHKVDLIAGGYSSETGLALSAFALQRKALYVAGAPRTGALIWAKGNRFTYRVAPSTFMLAAMLVDTAFTLPAKTWVTLAPDDDDGRSAVTWFRKLLSGKRPDVRFVGEQWVAPGRIDAGVVNALGQPGPDAIFNATLGSDLVAFARQGNAAGLFHGRTVASMQTGDPEYLDPLGDQAVPGWLVTGYPWSFADEPSNKQFVADFTARYQTPPTMAAVVGAAMVNAIESGILKSGGTDPEKMATGFADATFTSAFGICRFRTVDHQSTLGSYVGRVATQNGHGGMVDWRYVDGASVMPPDDLVRQMRPG